MAGGLLKSKDHEGPRKLPCDSSCGVFRLSLIRFVYYLLKRFNTWTPANVNRVGNYSELIVFTNIASFDNCSFIAIYTSMLRITFMSLMVPCYIYYKRHAFNPSGKVNAQPSQSLGVDGRAKDPHAALKPDLAQIDAALSTIV